MSNQQTLVTRRLFLATAAAALVRQQRSDNPSQLQMIRRSMRPDDQEMPSSGFSDFITPIEHFFVRTHVSIPRVDIETWRLTIGGHVSKPLVLSIRDIRAMPSTELVSVLECAGNGRSFYEPPVAGIQWTNGAVGNAQWRGIRLRDLLERAGVKAGAVEVSFDGADIPIGKMADFNRSIPLSKALQASTLLAYEMNGKPLSAEHGFPLRVVVPGWAGNSWVKWVQGISILQQASDGFWMKNAYLQPAKPVTPGSVVPASEMIPVTDLRVKSVISTPASGSLVEPGRTVTVRGAAWSGAGNRVDRVQVSTDEGRRWQPAKLLGPVTPFGWRLWEYPWNPPARGTYTLLARAHDTAGNTQPAEQAWNPSGYLWNVAARAEIHVGISPPSQPTVKREDLPLPPGFRDACAGCHEQDLIHQQRLTRPQWEREITKMTNWGANVRPDTLNDLLDYLERISSQSGK